MSTTPNEAKRARKAENGDVNQTTVSGSLIANDDDDNPDSKGNKWKRRLHSLRRSLTRRRVPDYKEYRRPEQQNFPEENSEGQEFRDAVADIRLDNNGSQAIFVDDCRRNHDRKSPLSNAKCPPKDCSTSNHPIASDNKTTVKKRKGFGRRTKGSTVRGNKNPSTSQQDLPINGENDSVKADTLGQSERDVKRKRKRFGRKSTLMFPSWFRTFGRSSGATKNVKLNTRGRGLSVSTGNFNEHDRNFKLLTDVRLLRDPGYVSSSADSLDRHDDLYEEKYNSLRRSRASLIDIRWHKHGQSEGNLASPRASASRNRSPLGKASDSRGTSSPNVAEFSPGKEISRETLICNNNCDNNVGTPKRDTPKARRNRLRNRNSVSECVSRENCAEKISRESNRDNCKAENLETDRQDAGSSGLKTKSFLSLPEEEDAYLTAEEDANDAALNLCDVSKYKHESSFEQLKDNVLTANNSQEKERNSAENERSVSITCLSTDDNGVVGVEELVQSEKHDFLTRHQSEGTSGTSSPLYLSKVPISSLSMSQPLRTLSSSPVEVLNPTDLKPGGNTSAKDNITGCQQEPGQDSRCEARPVATTAANRQKNSRKISLDHLNEYQENLSPLMKSRNCKSLTRVHSPTETCHDVVVLRPPKKPAPKPPSLMKNKSKSLTALAGKLPGLSDQLALNETSSVHKLNDSCGENLCELLSQSKGKSQSSEGVYVGILGDQGVILRKKRVLPRPNRVLSMPADLLENVMEVDGAESSNLVMNVGSISEISSVHISPFQSSGSEDYLSCTSKSPSPVTTDLYNAEKESCVRSLSISSIEVQDFSMQKKVQSQSVPCLVLNKDYLGAKLMQDNLGQDTCSVLENVRLSSPTCFTEGCKGCTKCSVAQSMVSLNHDLFEGDIDTSEKVRYSKINCGHAEYCKYTVPVQ